jgi:hypothetical protein
MENQTKGIIKNSVIFSIIFTVIFSLGQGLINAVIYGVMSIYDDVAPLLGVFAFIAIMLVALRYLSQTKDQVQAQAQEINTK